MAIQAKKAVRKKLHLKMALISPSGGGKTYSALRLCKGMGGKTLLANTEAERGYIYADEFDYDIVDIEAPFTPEKYIEAIEYAEKEGYDNLILDSASHEWSGKGGILELHDRMPGNSYTNWAQLTPRHNAFLDAQLYAKVNIISNLRGKDEYVLEEKNGKQVPKKVGLGAQQRQGFEYECQVTLLIDQDTHIASTSKDNTHLFEGQYDVLTEEHGRKLKRWLDNGEDAPMEKKAPGAQPAQITKLVKAFGEMLIDQPTLEEKMGKPLAELTPSEVDALRTAYTGLKDGTIQAQDWLGGDS